MKNIRIWTALLAVGVSLSVSAGWRIAGPQDPKPYEKTAVEELQTYLAKRLGGNALTVGGASAVTFHVGDTAFATEKGLSGKNLKDEEWVVKSFDGDVVVNGGGTSGTLYATYHFLEDILGVRFWSEAEEDVPDASALDLGALDLRGKPYFLYRDIYRAHPEKVAPPLLAVRRRLNRNGDPLIPAELGGGGKWQYGPPCHAHSLTIYFSPSKYGATHPEWYALMDGKRQTKGKKTAMCITNPGFRAEFLRLLKGYIAEGEADTRRRGVPAPSMYDVAMDDTPAHCECEACKAEFETYGMTGAHLRLYNEIAGRIAKDHPGIYISTLAYYYLEEPPKGGVVPADNLIVRLCDTRSNQAASIHEKGNDIFLKLLKAWGPITKNLFVWDYAAIYAQATKSFPFPSEFYYGDQYSAYAKHGVKGIFLEHEDQNVGDLWDIKYYLETRLMEDPFLDNAKLLDQALGDYFGAAAPHVKAARLHLDRIRKARKAFIGWTPELGEFDFIHQDDITKMLASYDRAERAVAGNEKLVRRVRRARLGTDDINRVISAFEKYRCGDGWRFDPDDLDIVGERYHPPIHRVDDPESPSGKAIFLDADNELNGHYLPPFLIGLRDQSALKTVATKFFKEPAATKGYGVYTLEDVAFPRDSFVFLCRSWQVQHQTGYPQLTAGQKRYDIRVHVKSTGPKYIPGSTETNGFWIGRMEFVPHGAKSAAVTNVVKGTCVGPVTVSAADAGNWTFDVKKTAVGGGEVLRIDLASAEESVPPRFNVSFSVPQHDIHFVWHTAAESPVLPPKWHRGIVSSLTRNMPLVALLDANDRAKVLFATSEAVLPVQCRAGLKEENCTVPCSLSFFTQPVSPMKSYSVEILLRRPDGYWADAVRDATGWMEKSGGYVPMAAPESAFDPLYSTWYAFTQDVSAGKIEDEARRAAKLGMRTLILDDGWQTDEKGRAYERCGDLTVSSAKFPDGMAAHVKRVQSCGIKYMAWFTISMVGYKNAAFERFRGKYLKDLPDVHCSILDPRFPEVRSYIVGMFERAMKEWGLDGFKIDYVGQFALGDDDKDPAVAEGFAGRDTRSVPDAVDLLMTELTKRLRAVKPDVLIEYRQPYLGPAIRRYGNMIRAIDCPGEMQKNIVRTAMLRLTSGGTAVHSDMLEWNASDTPERAAKPVLASLFSTIQYSMVLSRLPEGHLRMLRHWIRFTQEHRSTLLGSAFRPHHPEANYPLVEAEGETERIAAVYVAGTLAEIASGKRTIVVNATGAGELLVDCPRPSKAVVFDTFGMRVGEIELKAGLQRVRVPVAGFLTVG